MKKMILIDPRVLEQMKQRQSRVVADVEKHMEQVMDTDQTTREKVKEYNHRLTQLNLLEDKVHEPAPVPQQHNFEHDILESVPLAMRKRARLLLDRVKHKISWDERGQVIIRGRVVPGSHIVDLVNDALRHRKKSKIPQGRPEFAHEVQDIGIPQEIAQNPAYHRVTPPSPEESESEEVEEHFQDSFADWISYKK